MAKKIKEIDAYINRSADFAKPILEHIRDLVHIACPDVQEKIKWGFPHFDYREQMMCSMAAFKQHAVVSFWKGALMKDPALMENARTETAMGHLGKMTSLKDMPLDRKFIAYIKEAMLLNEMGIKLPAKPKSKTAKAIEVPDYFIKVLKKDKAAWKIFEAFSYSHKKEYVEWITEAKTAETRNKRMASAVEMISEGKSRHWKYAKK